MKVQTRITLILLFILACNDKGPDKADFLLKRGLELETMHLPDSAMIIYQKAIGELKNVKNDTLSGIIYNRIGDLLFGNDLYPEAFEPYKKAFIYNSRKTDLKEASKSLRGMGKSLSLQGLNDSALVYFTKARSFTSRISDQEEISLIHNNLSMAYYRQGKYRQSFIHNTKALQLSRDSLNIFKNCCIRGDLFFQTGQYDSALHYYKISYKSPNIRTQAASTYGMIDWAKVKKSKDSIQYIYTLQRLKDSIENQRKPFDILKKDKQFQVKEAKKEERIKYICFIAGILALSLTFALLFIRRHRVEKKKNERLNGVMAKHRTELSELKQEQEIRLSQKSKELERHREKELELKEHVFQMNPVVRKVHSLNSLKAIQRSKSEQQFILSFMELNSLERAMDLRFDDFASRLRANFPKLTNDDIHLCCLIKIRIPNKNILTLLNTNELTLKKRRYRIKHNKMELPETVATLDDYLADY